MFYSELDQQQVVQLAQTLAQEVKPGTIITLTGELGAGKTTFAQAFIQALSPEAVEVTSPTFTLMQSYPIQLKNGQKETLWHLDLYRLEVMEEAFQLGLEEIFPHITLMEWAGIITPLLPKARMDILFTFAKAEDKRNLEINILS